MKRVSKSFRTKAGRKVEVLCGLDLVVGAGEFVSLMGPSGSGKSTLLHLIGGLDHPDEGRITVAGKTLHDANAKALAAWRATTIGLVFQANHLLPSLTAQENVELPLLLSHLGFRERKEQVQRALRLVQLETRAGHRPAELSGGEQQRVGIARAIACDPAILLCDEPTGNLDHRTSQEILGLLLELGAELDKTVLMATHDRDAAKLAHRTVRLENGYLA